MRSGLFLIPLLLSSAACSKPDEIAQEAGVADGGRETPNTQATQSRKPFAFTKAYGKEGEGTFDFSYSWPGEVSAEPELAKLLEKDLGTTLETTRGEWEASREECPVDAGSCRNHSYANEVAVVANLPRYLSLSNDFATYTGGAHGMYGRGSAVWDRQTRAYFDPKTMFVSPAALQSAVSERFCTALDAEREKRRGMPVDAHDDIFGACPPVEELQLFIGSSNGKAFDRITLYAGPYVAGAYAEGAYEIDLDVDAALKGAVKPEYADAFAVRHR